jgi:parvulin-like peptidyl-prolyl isomerase
VLIIGMAVAFAGGLLYGTQCNQPTAGGAREELGVAGKIGQTNIYAADIERVMMNNTGEMMRMFSQEGQAPPQFLPPFIEASSAMRSVSQSVDMARTIQIAKDRGVKLDPNSIRAARMSQIDVELGEMRKAFETRGTLKAGATDADFAAAFEKENGRPLADVRKDVEARIEQQLADTSERHMLEVQAAAQFLLDEAKARARPTDEDLKLNYSTLEFRRILLKDEGSSTAQQQAEKVAGELKANTIAFDAAVDRYSKDPPQAGKRLSENTISLSGNQVLANPDYAALRLLKPNETSAPVKEVDGVAIYRLLKSTPNLPPDFEKQKDTFRNQLAMELAQRAVQKQIDDAGKTMPVTWTMTGYEALHKLAQADRELLAKPDERHKVNEEALKLAEDAITKGGSDARAAVLAQFVAFEGYKANAKADKAKVEALEVKVIEDLLRDTPNPQLYLQLVDVFVKRKEAEKVGETLVNAARANTGVDAASQAMNADIAGRVLKLKGEKLISAEVEKAVQEEQKRWADAKLQWDKEQAEQKALEEQTRKEMEAEQKKFEAEQKKMQEDAEKNKGATPSPAPGGSGSIMPPPTAPPSDSSLLPKAGGQ